jgi:hypothetical protein
MLNDEYWSWTLAITILFPFKHAVSCKKVFPFPLNTAKLTGNDFHNMQQGTEPEF